MNRNVACLISFALGAVAGSGVCLYYAQKKYDKKYQEDVAAVREAFATRLDELSKSNNWTADISVEEVPTMTEANETREPVNDDILNRTDYEKPKPVDYAAFSSKTEPAAIQEEPKKILIDHPYVIHPDDFGECGYQKISLTYYNDGVLAEFEDEEPIEDIDETIGIDSLKFAGEYEPDVVYVRNDARKCDYEVSLDGRDYEEAVGRRYYH